MPPQDGQWPYQQNQYPQHQQQPYPQQQYPGQYGPPQQQWTQPYQQVPPRPPKRRNRGLIIGLVVALVLLLGGGGTWFALSQRDSVASGAATPTEAAQNLAKALSGNDVVGMVGALAPAEAKLLTEPIGQTTDELKRLGILKADADPKTLTGLQVKAENLVFDEAGAERVNDHLTITKLTGGTITVTGDPSKLPLADRFRDLMPADEGPQTETIDIADEVRDSGEPIRIATVKVDGDWYPSLLYTIADYALQDEHEPWPTTSIPARGASSPNEAVKQLVQAALDEDVTRVIELLPPDEMAVLHDAGPALVAAAREDSEPSGAKLTDLRTETSAVPGGTRATITHVEFTDPSGGTYSVTKNGDCYDATGEGRTEHLCADYLADNIENEIGSSVPEEVTTVLQHLSTGVLDQGLGVVTTEVGGLHYVSPLRTFNELGLTVLRSLQPGDIDALLRLAE
ncbi:flagellar basal body protein FliL [Amycolatopsis thermophila]|nr:flagellar basal body protein FliL [Amycolatopsis thermophila]